MGAGRQDVRHRVAGATECTSETGLITFPLLGLRCLRRFRSNKVVLVQQLPGAGVEWTAAFVSTAAVTPRQCRFAHTPGEFRRHRGFGKSTFPWIHFAESFRWIRYSQASAGAGEHFVASLC